MREDEYKFAELVARMRYEFTQGRRLTYSDIGKKLRDSGLDIDDNKAQHLGKEWERLGRVISTVFPWEIPFAEPVRCPRLEQQLCSQYRLRGAVVARIAPFFASDKSKDEEYRDDLVHQLLGNAAASLLAAVFRNNDRLGIGSGRGPFYASCAWLRSWNSPSRARIGELMSLTGRMGVSVWKNAEAFLLDADALAGVLTSLNLGVKKEMLVKVSLIRPLRGGKGHVPQHLMPAHWKSCHPSVVLVGIGALGGGHRLWKADPDVPELQDARAELIELRAAVRKIDEAVAKTGKGTKGFVYHCVGDLCNRLFVVDPTRVAEDIAGCLGRAEEPLDWLKGAVKKLNDRIMAPTFTQLRESNRDGAVIAVAGGRHKLYSILHVLKQTPAWISHLVTDDETAKALCPDSPPDEPIGDAD